MEWISQARVTTQHQGCVWTVSHILSTMRSTNVIDPFVCPWSCRSTFGCLATVTCAVCVLFTVKCTFLSTFTSGGIQMPRVWTVWVTFVICGLFRKQRTFAHVDFMPHNTTINADAYYTTLRFRKAIQNRRRGKLSHGIVLIHDNACPHTARQTQTLLHDEFHWDTFDHPPYSPGLAPSSNFYLFLKMKEHLAC